MCAGDNRKDWGDTKEQLDRQRKGNQLSGRGLSLFNCFTADPPPLQFTPFVFFARKSLVSRLLPPHPPPSPPVPSRK